MQHDFIHNVLQLVDDLIGVKFNLNVILMGMSYLISWDPQVFKKNIACWVFL